MEYGQRLWDTLWDAGQPDGLAAAGYRAIDSLRLEKGYRYWSADIGPDYTPYEAGLGLGGELKKGGLPRGGGLAQEKGGGDPAQPVLPGVSRRRGHRHWNRAGPVRGVGGR